MRSPLKAKNRCDQQAQNTVPGWIEFNNGHFGGLFGGMEEPFNCTELIPPGILQPCSSH